MKTSNIIRLSILIFAGLVISLTGCKKNSSSTDQGLSNTTSLQNLANDETQVNKASDEALNDINNVLGGGQETMKSTEGLPCNATLDSTNVVNDTITYYITYNGLNCDGNLFRTGQIEIKKHVNTRWHQAGATVTYIYINYHVYHVLHPAKWITLNGTKTYENVSGGLLFMLGSNGLDSIIHKEWGTMSIAFEDGTTRTWDIARHLTYTMVNEKLVLTTNGLGSADNYNNLIVWGINRDGEQFYDQILVPNVFKQKCEWDPCAGQKKFMVPSAGKGDTITWGYNSDNQPISGDECPTKYKVDWYTPNQSGTMYLFLP
ncbi:MAG: hypothetical protein ABSD71_14425 [Bacteroidales bacterium]